MEFLDRKLKRKIASLRRRHVRRGKADRWTFGQSKLFRRPCKSILPPSRDADLSAFGIHGSGERKTNPARPTRYENSFALKIHLEPLHTRKRERDQPTILG